MNYSTLWFSGAAHLADVHGNFGFARASLRELDRVVEHGVPEHRVGEIIP